MKTFLKRIGKSIAKEGKDSDQNIFTLSFGCNRLTHTNKKSTCCSSDVVLRLASTETVTGMRTMYIKFKVISLLILVLLYYC